MTAWQKYSERFLSITPREQYLIIITGMVVIMLGLYSAFIDDALTQLMSKKEQSQRLLNENNTLTQTQAIYQQALLRDPNSDIDREIEQYKQKVQVVDGELLSLTSEFIDPVQMRLALLELLNVSNGVSLQSFELLGAEKISLPTTSTYSDAQISQLGQESGESFVLYKHGVKLRLTGRYFNLQNYLSQLEALKWRFFWQEFNYNIDTYPNGDLEVVLYSLSTDREFLGV